MRQRERERVGEREWERKRIRVKAREREREMWGYENCRQLPIVVHTTSTTFAICPKSPILVSLFPLVHFSPVVIVSE